MVDKYGTGQDPYCYPGSTVLRNNFDLHDDEALEVAERMMSEIAASEIEFHLPPYDLSYLQEIHRKLFRQTYDWAGKLRSIDISKGDTRFCTASRIEPEANKLFSQAAQVNWFEGLARRELVQQVAEFYGDLNMVHPFRDGNGRAQRILFEHLIINAGYEISWWAVEPDEWTRANIAAVACDYQPLIDIFERCIGQQIA